MLGAAELASELLELSGFGLLVDGLQRRVGALAGTTLTGVGDVDLLLVARQAAVATLVGIEPAPTLWDSDRWSTALVGGVGQHVDLGGVERVDQTVFTSGTPVVPRAGSR